MPVEEPVDLTYNYFDDGTIAPYAAISSIVFAPEIVLPTIKIIK